MNTPTIQTASVRVMRSYDYNHFEVALTSSDATTPEQVDDLRKQAARLADKAIEQYKVAKEAAESVSQMESEYSRAQAEKTPENERTPEQKAILKYHSDYVFASRFQYDYDDEWEPPQS